MSDWAIERGRERLSNWARWASAPGLMLGYQHRAPYARDYLPDAGDIWEPAQSEAPIDELEAQAVEAVVVALPQQQSVAVRMRYIQHLSARQAAKALSVNYLALRRLVDSAERSVGLAPLNGSER